MEGSKLNTKIIESLKAIKLIPVVVLNNVEASVPLGRVLINSGLPCAEVTFRTEESVNVLKTLKKEFPSLLLGAGTVLSIENAKKAIDVGVSFIVSPGFDRQLVEYCLKQNVFVIPGVATASEIQVALSMGLKVLKFFPATDLGGVPMIKALSAPFKEAQFVPTGGITKSNVCDFLACPSVLACGGTWMVKKDLLEAGNWKEVESLVKEAVQLVQVKK